MSVISRTTLPLPLPVSDPAAVPDLSTYWTTYDGRLDDDDDVADQISLTLAAVSSVAVTLSGGFGSAKHHPAALSLDSVSYRQRPYHCSTHSSLSFQSQYKSLVVSISQQQRENALKPLG